MDTGIARIPAATWPQGAVALSTDGVDTRDRFDFWHDMICRLYVQLGALPLARAGRFGGQISGFATGSVQLTRVTAAPHLAIRTPAEISRANGHYFLVSLMLDGTCQLVQDDRNALLKPGDFALYETNRPYSLRFEEPFGMLVLQMPQGLLRAVLPKASSATATVVDGNRGTATLVRPLLEGLLDTGKPSNAASQQHLAAAAVELVAASLANVTCLGTEAPLHQVHLARIRQFVEENICDADLSPETIARAVHISPRYLHALFHRDGVSASRYVMDRRLDKAYQDLRDPRLAHLTVGEMATRLGFKDPSHFIRVFRTRFGLSPRAYRNSADVDDASRMSGS
ncbi:helix-turn-helix domain-containing protein [Dactylosporangium maewongense]|uniref:Helix-turn-helix domain-containing protein n=1 Tax=Dactylosporangium maewongense TaxID=634393 RepID=A0ABN2CT63_9ACTN